MKRTVYFVLLCVLILLPIRDGQAQDEPESLTRLVFSADVDNDARFERILMAAPALAQVTTFYTDEAASVIPVSWSPSGQYLAIFRDTFQDVIQLCLLDRAGQMKGCFDEGVSRYAYTDLAENYTVTWSDDERHAYFVVERDRLVRFVEADVRTGAVQRTIHEADGYYEHPSLIHWTPTGTHLAIYSGDEAPFRYTSDYEDAVAIRPVSIVSLQTGQQTPLRTGASDGDFYYFCEGFSPEGDYLTARSYRDVRFPASSVTGPMLTGLVFVDMTGEIVRSISQSELEQFNIEWVHCPTWLTEEAVYFLAGGWTDNALSVKNTAIYRYSLPEDIVSEIKVIEAGDGSKWLTGPLVLSQNGTFIAFSFRDAAVLNEVAVLLPSGEVAQISDPNVSSIKPLWLPEP